VRQARASFKENPQPAHFAEDGRDATLRRFRTRSARGTVIPTVFNHPQGCAAARGVDGASAPSLPFSGNRKFRNCFLQIFGALIQSQAA
jgi:hypothetical protein